VLVVSSSLFRCRAVISRICTGCAAKIREPADLQEGGDLGEVRLQFLLASSSVGACRRIRGAPDHEIGAHVFAQPNR